MTLFFAEPNAPLPADAQPGQGIHHPRFGEALKSKLDPLGIECVLGHWTDYPKDDDHIEDMCRDMTGFLCGSLRRRLSKCAGLPNRPLSRPLCEIVVRYTSRPASTIKRATHRAEEAT